MRHGQASVLLGDLANGALDAATRAELVAHVESCDECRGWLSTYRLISAALDGSGAAGGDGHPRSDLLAGYVLNPLGLSEAERAEVFQHSGNCESCRRQMEITRAAVLQARPPEAAEAAAEAEAAPVARPARRHRAWRFALAAGLAAALLGSALILRSRTETPAAAPIAAGLLQGNQVIDADGTTYAMAVESGSQVTLRADDFVALGDGFAVGSDADLTIELTRKTSVQ